MTDPLLNLPPFPAAKGPKTANRLRYTLAAIDGLIKKQEEALATIDESFARAFTRHDAEQTTRNRIQQLAKGARGRKDTSA